MMKWQKSFSIFLDVDNRRCEDIKITEASYASLTFIELQNNSQWEHCALV